MNFDVVFCWVDHVLTQGVGQMPETERCKQEKCAAKRLMKLIIWRNSGEEREVYEGEKNSLPGREAGPAVHAHQVSGELKQRQPLVQAALTFRCQIQTTTPVARSLTKLAFETAGERLL